MIALEKLGGVCVLLGSLLLWPLPANADDGAKPADAGKPADYAIVNRPAGNAKLFTFDYGVPASPALTLAGLSPDKIKPATSLKPFVLSLPGLFDGSGNGSAALDVSPAWLFDPEAKTATATFRYDKVGNYWERVLTRTRLGIALYRGDDGGGDPKKSKPSRLAFGLSFGLADGSDPLTAGPEVGLALDSGDRTQWMLCAGSDANKELLMPAILSKEEATLQNDKAGLESMMNPPPGAKIDIDKSFVRNAEYHYFTSMGRSGAELTAAQSQMELLTKDDTDDNWHKRISKDIDNFVPLIDDMHRRSPDFQKEPERLAALQGCQKQATAAAEHGVDLQVGLGVMWSGTPGKLSDFDSANEAFWVAGRFPLGVVKDDYCTKDDNRRFSQLLLSCWMFGGSARASLGEMVATGNTATPLFKANTVEGWVGLERVSDSMKIGGYVGYLDQAAAETVGKPFAKSGTRWLVSGAISLDSIYEGAWIVGSYGAANGSVTALDDKVAMLTLTFAPPKIGSSFAH